MLQDIHAVAVHQLSFDALLRDAACMQYPAKHIHRAGCDMQRA